MNTHSGSLEGSSGTNGSNGASGSSHRYLEIPDESLSPAMEEMASALARLVPDPALRLAMVRQMFRKEDGAPYRLGMESLTGSAIPEHLAQQAWEMTLELRSRWSGRLGEVVGLKAAASEAADQCMAGSVEAKNSPAQSLRTYLDRDGSTGLYSRTHYEARISEEIRVSSAREPLALALIRFHGVVAVAARQGPAGIEEAYRRIGQLLRNHFRPTDVPCRYGGDCYAVLMPATPEPRAEALVEDLLSAMKQTERETKIHASAGIGMCFQPGVSPQELESSASMALRLADEGGECVLNPASAHARQRRNMGLAAAVALAASLGAAYGAVQLYTHRSALRGDVVSALRPAAAPLLQRPSAPVPPAQPTPAVSRTAIAPAVPPPAAKLPAPPSPYAGGVPGRFSDGKIDLAILHYYQLMGPQALGNPYNNGGGAAVHTWRMGDYRVDVQDFRGGTHGKLILFTTLAGAVEVSNHHGFWDYYLTAGGLKHFGIPSCGEYAYRGHYRQNFAGHYLLWTQGRGVQEHVLL